MPRTERLVLTLCFFLSGAAGLIDEVVWSRYLNLIFGSTSYSIATVIATYMAGLGLGSFLFGRIADRSRRPARLYAFLELLIGAYAVISPFLLGAVQSSFVAIQRAFEPGPLVGAWIKAALASIVLLVPTVLMGGTLPLLARYLAARGVDTGRGVGLLYGLNTLGAVAGSFAAGFLLVPRLGHAGSLLLASSLNVLAGLGMLLLRTAPVSALEPAERRPLRELLRSEDLLLAAGLALFAGLGSLVAEVAWTRVLALLIGSSTWSFALVLTGFLLGIGYGSWLIGRRGSGDSPLLALGWAQCLAAAGIVSLLLGFTWVLRGFIVFQQNPLAGFHATLACKGLLVLGVVLPATIGMGMSFPLLAAAGSRGLRQIGQGVGLIYAANTAGSIAGSLLGGFVLLGAAGSFATLRFAAWVHAAVALAAFGHALKSRGRARLVPAAAVMLGLVAALVLVRPWPPHLLNLGTFLYAKGLYSTQVRLDAEMQRGKLQLIFAREGLSSLISVWDLEYTRGLRNNGKTDAGTGGDMATQVELGLRPLLAHPTPREVLIIGAGSGMTAAAVAEYPGVESIDLVEIERAVIEAGALFEGVNRGVYRDPRVRVILEDGRNHLLTTRRQYDVIISEPSNPWMAGVGNLFTSEFYALVRSRLKPDGVFSQWVQHYDMRPSTIRRMSATLLEAFPELELWTAGGADLQFLAGRKPFALTIDRARALVEKLGHRWRDYRYILEAEDAEDLLVWKLLDRAGVAAFTRDAAPYLDDPPELEFEAMRSLGEHEWGPRLQRDALKALGRWPPRAEAYPEPRPGFSDYAEGRVRMRLGDPAGSRAALERAEAARSVAKDSRWLGDVAAGLGDGAAAQAAWQRAVEREPGNVVALFRMADLRLQQGDPGGAGQWLAAIPPGEKDTAVWAMEADLAARTGQRDLALHHLRNVAARLPVVPDAQMHLSRIVQQYRTLAADPAFAEKVIHEIEAHGRAAPRVLAWPTLMGEVLEAQGQHSRAMEAYLRVLRYGPELMPMVGLARSQIALGQLAQARLTLDGIRRYQPWNLDLRRLDQALKLREGK